jgi:hypothetical protein
LWMFVVSVSDMVVDGGKDDGEMVGWRVCWGRAVRGGLWFSAEQG